MVRIFVLRLEDIHSGPTGWEPMTYSGVVVGNLLPSHAKELFWHRIRRRFQIGMKKGEGLKKMRCSERQLDNSTCFVGEAKRYSFPG